MTFSFFDDQEAPTSESKSIFTEIEAPHHTVESGTDSVANVIMARKLIETKEVISAAMTFTQRLVVAAHCSSRMTKCIFY